MVRSCGIYFFYHNSRRRSHCHKLKSASRKTFVLFDKIRLNEVRNQNYAASLFNHFLKHRRFIYFKALSLLLMREEKMNFKKFSKFIKFIKFIIYIECKRFHIWKSKTMHHRLLLNLKFWILEMMTILFFFKYLI